VTVIQRRAPMLMGAICLLGCALLADDPPVSIPIRGHAPVTRPDFRMDSDLVLIPVNVTDARNHAVTGLSREAFRVFEDQTEQTVVQFAKEDAPLSVGIVFDSSGSMTGKLPKSREAMRQFLQFANPEDEFFLVEFSSRARLTVPFTTNSGDIQNRLLNAQPKGKTALLDAVCLAMESLRHARYSRRALLVLSDGGDNNSRFTETEVRNRIRESDLWIYSMGIYDQPKGVRIKAGDPGQKLLENLAAESGGRHFAVDSLVDLPVVAARISLELRNQYVLGYRPSDSRHDGKYHQVHVTVVHGQDMHVSWRPGYYGTIQ
jgi:Ca-activated chloride channel homolog